MHPNLPRNLVYPIAANFALATRARDWPGYLAQAKKPVFQSIEKRVCLH
jgi:hypothetical protein